METLCVAYAKYTYILKWYAKVYNISYNKIHLSCDDRRKLKSAAHFIAEKTSRENTCSLLHVIPFVNNLFKIDEI
jgi:hypothetical protein